MIRNSINFAFQLALVLIIIGGIHLSFFYVRELALPLETLLLCYIINFLLALGIYVTMLKMAEERSKYLGFVFLFGSALKLIVYFLIFDPLFRRDGSLERTEFFLFFVPYIISLIVETVALVKLLRTLR